jgi:hypothetical protein
MEKQVKQQTGLSESEKEIGEAIQEGAITKQYLADPHTIVSSLMPLPSASTLSKARCSSKWWAKISCSNAEKWRRTARSFERLERRIWSHDNCYSASCKRRSSMPASWRTS